MEVMEGKMNIRTENVTSTTFVCHSVVRHCFHELRPAVEGDRG
jgi:hypothetical protein